jgi:hypothetical protein
MNEIETIRYRIVAREVLVENLTLDEANIVKATYEDQGKTGLVMEEYDPQANRLGRDPDLH